MSRRLPYLRIFVSDELVLGQGLTAQEFGARMRLLFRAWMNEGKLPNDPKRLAAWAGVNGGRWNEISETVLADHFKLAGHELIASNLVQQLDDDSARIEASRRGGKRSAELRGSALEAPSALTSSAPEVASTHNAPHFSTTPTQRSLIKAHRLRRRLILPYT